MYIKSYSTRRFAGIKDLNLNFEKGLNVILGPNESGKSTVVNGIHSSLFKTTNLSMAKNKDKYFLYRYSPLSGGDSIDGKLVFEAFGGEYSLKREWGETKGISLLGPDGSIYKKESAVEKELDRLLVLGETSYSNIVFAKQRDLKAVLDKISEDPEIKRDIGDMLRRAVMELDGISLDQLEDDINKEIDRIYSRWDLEKNYPENNRGINNPYVNGLGSLVESYYKKERLKLDMEEAHQLELKFESLAEELKVKEDLRKEKSQRRRELEALEEDMNKRSVLELEIGGLETSLAEMMEVVKNWPMTKERVKELEKSEEEFKKKRLNLEEELRNLKNFEKKKSLEEKLEKLEKIDLELRAYDSQRPKALSKEDIKALEDLDREIVELRAALNAGSLVLKLIRSKEDLKLTRDFKEEVALEEGQEIEAKNSILIKSDSLELSLKLGKLDYEDLASRLRKREARRSELLLELSLDSLEEAKLRYEEILVLERKSSILREERKLILGDWELDDLKEELKAYESLGKAREEGQIDNDLADLREEEIRAITDKKSKEDKLGQWEAKYVDFDHIFNMVGDKRLALSKKKEEEAGLKNLPEDFETVEDFRTCLKLLREDLERLETDILTLNSSYYELKNSLMEETYEEMKLQYMDLEREFERNMARGEKLLKVRENFYRTKEKMLSNPMDSLVRDFRELLEIITLGRYDKSSIGEDLNIRLEGDKEELPIDLLSAGTYDSVSLALRFALLKYIFKSDSGFLILDDCLVDLDPERKDQSIRLIREFSKDYQIIFTTCNPKTAELLGGNIIELERI